MWHIFQNNGRSWRYHREQKCRLLYASCFARAEVLSKYWRIYVRHENTLDNKMGHMENVATKICTSTSFHSFRVVYLRMLDLIYQNWHARIWSGFAAPYFRLSQLSPYFNRLGRILKRFMSLTNVQGMTVNFWTLLETTVQDLPTYQWVPKFRREAGICTRHCCVLMVRNLSKQMLTGSKAGIYKRSAMLA